MDLFFVQLKILCLCELLVDMIEELISKGQQLDAVHFTYEVGLVEKFPPVPLLKSFLKDAKKVAASILEDPNNAGRAAVLFTLVFINIYIYDFLCFFFLFLNG